MKLYNSTSRVVEEFVPYNADKVTMYTCGPTVYNYAHIGNLRSYIMEDVLEKTIKFMGYNVVRAMNITDVGHLSDDGDYGDDKMVEGAKKAHKTVMEIAQFYTEAFKADFARLHLHWPDIVVPATSCIDKYIEMITVLMQKGYAYCSQGNVYFDTTKLKEYYRFGNQSAEDLAVAVRDSVEEDKGKRNKNDFVLWFTKSKFENQALKWDSPWGVGYPGWHIECSGISNKYLGEYLDIHCGGVDNKFPHHTNEIAQTESYTGHEWCKYWFHVAHLRDASGKMSKSKGGILTVSKLIEEGYSPMHYKLFCLQSHYRRPLVYSIEGMDGAKSAYEKIAKKISQLNDDGAVNVDEYNNYRQIFADRIGNDLNTALAVTTIFDVLKANINDATKCALIREFDKVFDLGFVEMIGVNEKSEKDNKQVDTAFVESEIERRRIAKQNKDYATADAIRNNLLALGVKLIDTPTGTNYEIE